MEYPVYEGEMQRKLDAALEHLSSVWGQLKQAGLYTREDTIWPPSTNGILKYGSTPEMGHILYSLAAVTEYVYATYQGMRKQWGDDEGQLCPYHDCAYDLALPHSGWYTCGHCLREFWCEASDGIEDYHCYIPGKNTEEPSRPTTIPIARVLGRSWASPEE